MIKELATFSNLLDENFKNLGLKPKEGLHILLTVKNEGNATSIDMTNYGFEIFSNRLKKPTSDFLNKTKQFHQYAWCIDTNKCFDLPIKAIQSCSPFCVAFKREYVIGGKKYEENSSKKKSQIYDRFANYFEKAFKLLEEENRSKYEAFKVFFTDGSFSEIINRIKNFNLKKRDELYSKITSLKDRLKSISDKGEKESAKFAITELEQEILSYKELEDSDYILFYLDIPLAEYKEVYKKYLDDKLFNTANYNTVPNQEGLIFGTSNFMNGFNDKMPFLLHQTASFDISGRITNIEAKLLNDFKGILPNKTLPNPLPIFIYKDELQHKVILIFKENSFKIGYKEIVQILFKNNPQDLENYYLLFWANTKEGIVFKDFDFVSKFKYLLEAQILNLFNIREKDNRSLKHYPNIKNIFEFEENVFKQLLQNKYLKLDYFKELDKEDYEKKDFTFISYSKFRKSVYDFVYKSQRQSIDGKIFDEMVFNKIKDDLKVLYASNNSKAIANAKYSVKEKLNIWYSMYEFFNPQKNTETMASKLQSYQQFVDSLINESNDAVGFTDKQFAFAAGQVIYYIIEKSKSADNSYRLLEPYLQKAKCSEFKQVIVSDFARYKHENFSKNFKRVASFVLSYETDENIKHLLPEFLSGVFAKNQLFSNNPQ